MDIRTGKVRNGWIAVLFLTSAVLCFLQEGVRGLGIGFFHMFLAFLLLLPIFAFRVLGAADIKIFLSLSVLFPLQAMLFIFISSILIGTLTGIVILVQDLFHSPKASKKLFHCEYHYIHFTIPIFISVLLYEYGGIYELLICNL